MTLTVVVPTRDRHRLLTAALRSLKRQARPPDQIVVVDDGSQVPLAESALRALAPGVELARHDRPRGVSAARNTGLDQARGSALMFLDDDDLVHPRLVADAVARLEGRPEAGAVVFGYSCFGAPDEPAADDGLPEWAEQGGLPARRPRGLALANPVPAGVLEARPVSAFLRYLIPVHSCVVRRSAIGPRRFPEPLVQGEDTWFWIALANSGCRFAFDGRPYAYVRRHSGNTSRSRVQYERQIQACYLRLLSDGFLTDPDDAFLAHLKLAWFRARHGGVPARHLAQVALAPHRLAREVVFWLSNFTHRWRLAENSDANAAGDGIAAGTGTGSGSPRHQDPTS